MSYFSSFHKTSLATSLVIQAFTFQIYANQKNYQKVLKTKQADQPAIAAAATIKMLTKKQFTQQPFTTTRSQQISSDAQQQADLILSLSRKEQTDLLASWLVEAWLKNQAHANNKTGNKVKQSNQTEETTATATFKKNKAILSQLSKEIQTYAPSKQTVSVKSHKILPSLLNLSNAKKPAFLQKIAQSDHLKEQIKKVRLIIQKNKNGISFTAPITDLSLVDSEYASFDELPEELQLYILISWLNDEWDFSDFNNNSFSEEQSTSEEIIGEEVVSEEVTSEEVIDFELIEVLSEEASPSEEYVQASQASQYQNLNESSRKATKRNAASRKKGNAKKQSKKNRK